MTGYSRSAAVNAAFHTELGIGGYATLRITQGLVLEDMPCRAF